MRCIIKIMLDKIGPKQIKRNTIQKIILIVEIVCIKYIMLHVFGILIVYMYLVYVLGYR